MTEADRVRRRRRSRRMAALVALVVSLGALSVRLLADSSHRDVGRVLLVLCVLVVAMRLLGTVRARLAEQRPVQLRAPCSSPDRAAVVPADFFRIVAEIERARRSREDYRRGLGQRLEDLARRRGDAPVPPVGDVSRGTASRGLSVEEIGAVMDGIVES